MGPVALFPFPQQLWREANCHLDNPQTDRAALLPGAAGRWVMYLAGLHHSVVGPTPAHPVQVQTPSPTFTPARYMFLKATEMCLWVHFNWG